MSQENVEIVRQVFEAFNRGDIATVAELLHRDIELRERFEPSTSPGPHRGLEGVLTWYRDGGRHWSAYEVELVDAVAAGSELVVAEGEVRATGRTSGVETRQRFGYVYGLREGKVIQFEIFKTRAEALEAVGMSEQDAHSDS